MSSVIEAQGRGDDHRPDKDDKKTVTINVDGINQTVPKTKMTATELKALLGIAASQVIDIVDEDGTFHPVADDEEIKLRDGCCQSDGNLSPIGAPRARSRVTSGDERLPLSYCS